MFRYLGIIFQYSITFVLFCFKSPQLIHTQWTIQSKFDQNVTTLLNTEHTQSHFLPN